MEKQLQEKLKEAKAKIVANSKDAHFANALIDELVGLQKQADIEPVELIVPCAEVEHKHQIDDVTVLIKTVRGYLYKHGETTCIYVPFGLNRLYETMVEFDELLSKPERTDDEDLVISMIQRMLQWHTVAFYDAESLVDSATASATILNGIIERHSLSESTSETEEDIKANTEFEQERKAVEELVNAPVPDID